MVVKMMTKWERPHAVCMFSLSIFLCCADIVIERTLPMFEDEPVCAAVDFIEQTESISLELTFAGVEIFSKHIPHAVHNITFEFLGQKAEIGISNESISSQGACGCLSVDLIGLSDVPFEIGCFALGHKCFATNCQDYHTCTSCTTLSGCGFCVSTQMCSSRPETCAIWHGERTMCVGKK